MPTTQRAQRPCCMVSELLEEAGVTREKARRLKRQVLQGLILLCQWQLERMEREERPAPARTRGRRVAVE